MSLLLDRLKRHPEIDLAVVSQGGRRDYHFKAGGIEYFVVGAPLRELFRDYLSGYRIVPPGESQLKRYAFIVNLWNPDIVHIWGTELGYGLMKARGLIDKPTVVDIQGIMRVCAANAFGDLLPIELHGAIRSVLGKRPLCLRRWQSFVDREPAEEEALCSADMVMGRTAFDRAWAWAYRPDGRYRHVDRILRREFYDAAPWNLDKCRQFQVFCTSHCEPLKGLHVLLEAIYLLRQVYPEVKLNVASDGFMSPPQNDYARFVWRLVHKWNLEGVVTFLGFMDANGIVEQLRQANCYVMPSFIENSCNALQEAMLMGTPCVATSAGGTSTIIDEEQTGLLFPAGDAALLARQVARILGGERLAQEFSRRSRIVAKERNDPARIEDALLKAYEELLS
jgi:glycosyltransferase involved in cell wall biosynthesis